MLNESITIKYKHVFLLIAISFLYFYCLDRFKDPNFKKDLETVMSKNFSNETFFKYVAGKTHQLTGLLCLVSGTIINSLPV